MLIILRVLATFGGKLESASKSEIIPWASPRVVQSTEPCNQNRKECWYHITSVVSGISKERGQMVNPKRDTQNIEENKLQTSVILTDHLSCDWGF